MSCLEGQLKGGGVFQKACNVDIWNRSNGKESHSRGIMKEKDLFSDLRNGQTYRASDGPCASDPIYAQLLHLPMEGKFSNKRKEYSLGHHSDVISYVKAILGPFVWWPLLRSDHNGQAGDVVVVELLTPII